MQPGTVMSPGSFAFHGCSMAKLATLKPSVTTLRPRIGMAPAASEQERSRYRDQTQPWRKLYRTARWKAIRWSVLERDLFTCRMCHRMEGDTSKLVCDHVQPHRGDLVLFWEGPFQCLCATCHSSIKQAEERRG